MVVDPQGRENTRFFEDVRQSHLARVFSLISRKYKTEQLISGELELGMRHYLNTTERNLAKRKKPSRLTL
jgi:hypothetical protein